MKKSFLIALFALVVALGAYALPAAAAGCCPGPCCGPDAPCCQ